MSLNTWSQYVAMEDPMLAAPQRLDAALASVSDWDDDFDLGDAWEGEPSEDLETDEE